MKYAHYNATMPITFVLSAFAHFACAENLIEKT